MNNRRIKYAILCIFMIIIELSFLSFASAESEPETIENKKERYAKELLNYSWLDSYKSANFQRYVQYKGEHPNYSWETVITYVNIGLDNEFYTNVTTIAEPARTDVLVNKYNKLPDSYVPEGLETIDAKYCKGNMQLRSDAKAAFEKMCRDAAAIGLKIRAVSAYRSYETQDLVYHSKIDRSNSRSIVARDRVSARPGHSEHQLGLAVDVIATSTRVENTKEFEWYSRNAHKYGFIIRYPKGKEKITGYDYEPWHLRYLGVELATAVYNSGMTYDEYYARNIDVDVKSVLALPETVGITVDGNSYSLRTFRIGGASYFKLRDIAAIFKGTPKEFGINWDNENKIINLNTDILQVDMDYESFNEETYETSEELPEAGEGTALAYQSIDQLYVNGKETSFECYWIEGNNYFKIEDIAGLLGLDILIDPDSGSTTIKTKHEDVQAKE